MGDEVPAMAAGKKLRRLSSRVQGIRSALSGGQVRRGSVGAGIFGYNAVTRGNGS